MVRPSASAASASVAQASEDAGYAAATSAGSLPAASSGAAGSAGSLVSGGPESRLSKLMCSHSSRSTVDPKSPKPVDRSPADTDAGKPACMGHVADTGVWKEGRG